MGNQQQRGIETDRLGFESQLRHLLARRHWATDCISLSFLICRMGLIVCMHLTGLTGELSETPHTGGTRKTAHQELPAEHGGGSVRSAHPHCTRSPAEPFRGWGSTGGPPAFCAMENNSRQSGMELNSQAILVPTRACTSDFCLSPGFLTYLILMRISNLIKLLRGLNMIMYVKPLASCLGFTFLFLF